MNQQPRYLDIQEELYPEVTLHKQIVFDNEIDSFHLQIFERVAYDSYNRQIDLTDTISQTLNKAYEIDASFQILAYDANFEAFICIGCHPSFTLITLGDQFLQVQTIYLQIRNLIHSPPHSEYQTHQVCPEPFQIKNQTIIDQQTIKKEKKRTVKDILIVAEQWRKLYFQSNCKIELQEAANILGMTRRTLEDYLYLIRVAEKYNYPFELKVNDKIGEIRKFVKEKNSEKKQQDLEALIKLQKIFK